MKTTIPIHLVLLTGIIFVFPFKIYSQTKQEALKMEAVETPAKSQALERIFIDRFMVPQKSKQEFIERMNINRNFLKNLPGFVEHTIYERNDKQTNLICVKFPFWPTQ